MIESLIAMHDCHQKIHSDVKIIPSGSRQSPDLDTLFAWLSLESSSKVKLWRTNFNEIASRAY